ncbi:MAG: PVC-type heme-binding CxxCH protein [Verrucomicrobiota bacterium]
MPLLALNLLGQTVPAAKLHVPDGFVIDQAAGESEVIFPMFAAFDERGRLFVTESSGLDLYAELQASTRKCRVSVLEDRDGDGRFEHAQVFADNLVFPMGVVWRDGKLYVADPPDLVTLEDTDGDGRADKRTVILSGFGHTDNGSLHGLTFGPDGLLYLTMGSPDSYRLKRKDGTFLEGKTGALLRCRPDGSEVEVVCGGFENLVEVAFTPAGEIIGTDNWFQLPSGGARDALVHLVEGGLYPMADPAKTPLPFTGELLSPISLFPAVALSGLAFYRGQLFPDSMRGNLFSAQHNTRKVGRHALIRERSSFKTEDHDFVTSDDPDFHPSDVIEDADGSLLVVDTGAWYVQHCPTGKIRDSRVTGGIYRVRAEDGRRVEDPWGLKIAWANASVEKLANLLGDPRPMVRDRAQYVLSDRNESAVPALSAAGVSDVDVIAKLHAVWALSAIPGERASAELRRFLGTQMPEVQTAAAGALALRKDRKAADQLTSLLTAASPQVRLAVALALARCGDDRSLPRLWDALAGEPDRFLEHAVIRAAHYLAEESALQAALEHPNPRVQRAALVLLDQPPRPLNALTHDVVLQRVTAADAGLRQTALGILQNHPEWAKQSVELIEDWLNRPVLAAEQERGLRSLILAFQAEPSLQELIGAALASDATTDGRILLLLETVAQTSLKTVPQSWVVAFQKAVDRTAIPVRFQAVRTASALRGSALDGTVNRIAENSDEPVPLRVEALRAVVQRHPRLSASAFNLLVEQLRGRGDPVSRLAAAEVLRRSQLSDSEMLTALRAVRGDALISPGVLLPAFHESTSTQQAGDLLDFLAEAIRDGWRPTDEDLSKVFRKLPDPIRAKMDSLRALMNKETENPRAKLAEFETLLDGGRAEHGRTIFFGNKVACSTCHSIGNAGGKVGPDLTKAGAIRSGRDILESILLPSSTFAQGYESYFVTTSGERELSGIIVRQSGTDLVLRDASGAELQLRKDQIRELRRSAISIMPEGLERGLTREEFRDLLAFLKSLK